MKYLPILLLLAACGQVPAQQAQQGGKLSLVAYDVAKDSTVMFQPAGFDPNAVKPIIIVPKGYTLTLVIQDDATGEQKTVEVRAE